MLLRLSSKHKRGWFVVSDNEKLHILDIVTKVPDCQVDHQQFPIKRTVPAFSRRQLAREVGRRGPHRVDALLQNSTNSDVRGISDQTGRGVSLGMHKKSGVRKSILDRCKGCFSLRSPGKVSITFGGSGEQGVERLECMHIAQVEMVIKVNKS